MVFHLRECYHHPYSPLIRNKGYSPLYHPSIESTSYFTHLLSDMQETSKNLFIPHVFIPHSPHYQLYSQYLTQYSAVTNPMPLVSPHPL